MWIMARDEKSCLGTRLLSQMKQSKTSEISDRRWEENKQIDP